MKIETLLTRIENTTKKIEKTQGTLERHNKSLEKIKGKILSMNPDFNFNEYNKYELRSNYDLVNLIWDYEHKTDDIQRNEKKIKELSITLEKAQNSLAVEKKKKDDINNVIPECLITFLENWKQEAMNFYLKLTDEYIALKKKEYEVTEEELKKLYTKSYDYKTNKDKLVRRYSDEEIPEVLNSERKKNNAQYDINKRYLDEFRSNHFGSDIAILDKIIDYDKVVIERLESILDFEVQCKKESFVLRVQETVGVIEDMKLFTISSNGEINGIAIGDKCKANVETITAGGYNIQCLHYRVLVNKIN